jgi:hypothetical protein
MEVTMGELISGKAIPLLKCRNELRREQVLKLWSQNRRPAAA